MKKSFARFIYKVSMKSYEDFMQDNCRLQPCYRYCVCVRLRLRHSITRKGNPFSTCLSRSLVSSPCAATYALVESLPTERYTLNSAFLRAGYSKLPY
jgi:hypothetical protein